jgi:dUTP pyrophosphatase
VCDIDYSNEINETNETNEIKVGVFIEKCRETAVIPAYAREGDAGMDICSAEDIDISPGQTKIIPTGLKLAIPPGYEIQVRPRSGLSYKTLLRLANTPGTIDSGYRDELGVIMSNTGADIEGFKEYFEKLYGGRVESCNVGTSDNRASANSAGANDSSGNGVGGYETAPEGGANAGMSFPVYELSDPNLTESVKKPCVYRIKAGDRIAQIVISRAPAIQFTVVDSVADIGYDRGGGFGSSGV